MFGRSIELFRVFGFTVRLDPSWFIIAALLTFTLARQVFPVENPGLSAATYWAMGAVVTLGLFASVVAHELSHSLVARRFGLAMRGITLFIFGGVAEMSDEPASPKVELWMALAGPAMSIALGGALFALAAASRAAGALPPAAAGVVGYLAAANLALGVFNLIPAFPLDGGRVLRATLWHFKGSLRWATRVT